MFKRAEKLMISQQIYVIQQKKVKNMINPLSREQNQTDLNFLKKLVEQNKRLNTINPQLLIQIASLINITNCKFLETSELILRLKNKIVQILYEKKDSCLQYLDISVKIQNQEAFILVRQIVEQVWNQFKNKDKLMGTQKIIRFLCPSNNLMEQENFHLRNFQMIQNMFLFNQSQMFQHSMQTNFQMMAANFPNRPPQNIFPSGNNHMRNTQMNHPFNLMHNENMTANFQGMENYQTSQKMTAKIEQQIGQKNSIFKYKAEKKVETPLSTNKKSRDSPQLNLGSMRPFWYCVCKGKVSHDQKSFTCSKCEKKFHLSCFRIPENVKQKSESKFCPFCLVKGMNIFYEMVGDPVDYFFVTDKDLANKKITIKNKKCKQILDNKQIIHIRTLRIVGNTFFSFGNEMKSQEDEAHANKLGDIILKQDVLGNHHGEDVRINFDHMNFIPEEKKNSILVFVAACIARPLQEQELLLKITNEYCPSNYLARFFKQNQEQIRIEIINFEGGLINRPGRGHQCNHPDVFDINEFFSFHSTKLTENNCFVCRKRIHSIQIDRDIERQVNLIRESNLSYIPQYIYYRRDGTFRWEQNKHKNAIDQEPKQDVKNVEKLEGEVFGPSSSKSPFQSNK